MIHAVRLSDRPLLEPDPSHSWEAAAVFNCAVVEENGLIHMVYRATDIASSGKEGRFVSRLGYAVSTDGLHFNRLSDPILTNDTPQELRGLEDPRIVKIDDAYQMMYTGYRGEIPGDYRICRASSANLIEWERHGVVLDETNKDASLFPARIGDRYVMFHRRDPDIWIAYSHDLQTWDDHVRIMEPVPGSDWEDLKIGIAGPPMLTEYGWLLIYHGVNRAHTYSLGIALLDKDDPSKVLGRQSEPILSPDLSWERQGHVPNVVFSCGQMETEKRIMIYYCGADTVIGVAELRKDEITFV